MISEELTRQIRGITFFCGSLALGFGLLLGGTTARADVIDISSYFNQDTIINASGDDTAEGYRGPEGKYEYFATESGSATITGGDGTNGDGTDIPNNGQLSFNSASYTHNFELKNLTNTDGTDNTILLESGDNITLNIPDAAYDELAMLYAGVGFDGTNTNNGTVTVNYTTGLADQFTWDLADWSGLNVDAGAQVALGLGVDFYRGSSSAIISTTHGRLYGQVFDVDLSRMIASVDFAVGNCADDDVDFGIYSLSGEIPEPSTLVLLAVGGLGLLLWLWRRR